MDNDDVVDTLNKLIDTCLDGEYGFRTSAEHVKAENLRRVFLERAESCRKGASELQAAVVRCGGTPDEHSSAPGTLHRGWIALKGMLSGDSDQAALDECERGEDAALARYRDAIKQDLPSDIMAIVQRQYEGVKRNHDQIRSLRNEHRAKTT